MCGAFRRESVSFVKRQIRENLSFLLSSQGMQTERKRDGAQGTWNEDEYAPRMLKISSNHVGIAREITSLLVH